MKSAILVTAWTVWLITCLLSGPSRCAPVDVGFRIILPYNIPLKKALDEDFQTLRYYIRERGPDSDALKERSYLMDMEYKVLNTSSPKEILDLYCEEFFPHKVNTLLYLKANPGIQTDMTRDFIIDIAESLQFPVISWDPDFPGALQANDQALTIQLAPTLYHQCQLMLELLQRYNWTDFSLVTTSSVKYLEFINSVSILVQRHNSKRGVTLDTRLRILSQIVINMDPSDPTQKQRDDVTRDLRKYHHQDNRIFLLHTDSPEAKTVLEVAEELHLTGAQFQWIMTSHCVSTSSSESAKSYPLGALGLNIYNKNNDLKEVIMTSVRVAMKIWTRALARIRRDYVLYTNPRLTCGSYFNASWKHGKELYRVMKNLTVLDEDNTRVQLSKNGVNQLVKIYIMNVQNAIDTRGRSTQQWKEVGKWVPEISSHSAKMKVQMNEITWPGGRRVPPLGKPDRLFFRIVTLREHPYVMYRSRDPETGECGQHSVPCRLVYNPEIHKNDSTLENNTVSWCCTGLCIDLLTILSDRMGFDYELYEVPDQTWGLLDQTTGEWNGLIREVVKEEATMVLTSLKITPKRSESIDFSVPFLETGIAIVVSIRKGAISPTAFLEPYDYPSWCLILVFSVHATGAAIFIYEWLSPSGLNQGKTSMRDHRFSLFRSLWMIWAMLFGAAVQTDNPRGVSSRFLSNVWALFALVFLASYTANLAAFMITKDEYYNLSGIKDMRLRYPYSHKPPLKFGTIPNGSTEENLRTNQPEMFKYMRQYAQSSVPKALQSLKDGLIQAFIYDATPLEFAAGNDDKCRLITVGEWYAMTGYGIGFPKGSPWVERVDQIILELQKSGELERLRKFWLAGSCRKQKKRGQSSHNIGILNFTSAFIFLAAGVLTGVILMLAEHVYFKFGRTCLKKYDKTGCCELISLSMGKSLTFEQSVIEAIDLHRKHRCKDVTCETQLWKARHELDMSRLIIDRLKDQLTSYGIKPLEHWKPAKVASIEYHENKPNGYAKCVSSDEVFLPRDESREGPRDMGVCHESYSKEQLLPECEPGCSRSSTSYDDNSLQRHWSKCSLRRSPSYTNAISIDASALACCRDHAHSHVTKVRCQGGKYYMGVDTQSDDFSTTNQSD